MINATQCTVPIIWVQTPSTTIIALGYTNIPITNDTLRDYVDAMVLLSHTPDGESPIASHNLDFACVSWQKCNDEMNLKRILHSLIIENHFFEELYSLVQVVKPFTNESAAACYEYVNITDDCQRTSLDACQRCQNFHVFHIHFDYYFSFTLDFNNIVNMSELDIFLLKNLFELNSHLSLTILLKCHINV